MKKQYFSRVDRQVAVLLGVMLILFSVSIYIVSTQIYYHSILENLISRVENIHKYIEHELTLEAFLEIHSKEDMDKDSYQELKEQMEEIRAISDLRYLYTAKKDETGKLVYVVDGLPESAEDFRYPGDLIEPEIQAELERALQGETVLPEKILDTDWGNIFIAYYPLHDSAGTVVGALGIEVAADVEAEAVSNLSKAVFSTCLIFCGIAFVASILIFRRISNPSYRDMANTDFMTKLKNRNSYETDRQNLEGRKKTADLTVVVIDINNLKLANDKLGHEVGDACIINAAKILRNLESDQITAYRYGGDEFVLLMENEPNPDMFLSQVKEKFREYGDKLEVPVALAIGYAQFDKTQDKTILDTQKRADERMYQDKVKIKKKEQNESEGSTE